MTTQHSAMSDMIKTIKESPDVLETVSWEGLYRDVLEAKIEAPSNGDQALKQSPLLTAGKKSLSMLRRGMNLKESAKVARLVRYTGVDVTWKHYPELAAMKTRFRILQTFGIIASVVAPRSYFNKLVITSVIFGLSQFYTNSQDFKIIHDIAITGPNMDQSEQELRNVLEFYYFFRQNNAQLNLQEKAAEMEIMEQLTAASTRYRKYNQLAYQINENRK